MEKVKEIKESIRYFNSMSWFNPTVTLRMFDELFLVIENQHKEIEFLKRQVERSKDVKPAE